MGRLKVLWAGDLVVPTGFSTVGHNIILNNLDEWDVTGVGVNYNGDPHDFPFRVFPAMLGGNIYGIDRVAQLASTGEFDVIFLLNDAWVISYYLETIKKNLLETMKDKLPKIVVYFPVDSKYHDPAWYKDFDIVTKAFTYTEFGKKVVQAAVPGLDIGIIPHGVDLGSFYKMQNEGRLEARKKLFHNMTATDEKLKDLFIVLNAGRNQPRKRLDITVEGFSIFAYNKPETVKLYMHCGLVDSSMNVPYIARRFGVENRLIISNHARGIQKVPVERLNLIYNACDVGINTGMGEGWGLPNVEHAVTGAVQVVPRHSACEELFSDCGILMETVTNYMFDNSQTVGRLTTAREVARALETLYTNRELTAELSNKGMRKFTQPAYEWQHIAKQ
jgi:glycosyltransferase involved in cell wall biosynthesis